MKIIQAIFESASALLGTPVATGAFAIWVTTIIAVVYTAVRGRRLKNEAALPETRTRRVDGKSRTVWLRGHRRTNLRAIQKAGAYNQRPFEPPDGDEAA
jgi:hypothetical protein